MFYLKEAIDLTSVLHTHTYLQSLNTRWLNINNVFKKLLDRQEKDYVVLTERYKIGRIRR
jgi:hypothetical protein